MELRSLPFGARPAGDSFSTRAGMEEDRARGADPSKLLRGRARRGRGGASENTSLEGGVRVRGY